MRNTRPFTSDYVPEALGFERVMEGRFISSQDSQLLTLPVEITSFIINYIDGDRDTLANLALVNSDCRQISRSFQFRSVTIDFRYDRVLAFVGALLKDGGQLSEATQTKRPSLAVCIRQIRILTRGPGICDSGTSNQVRLDENTLRSHESHLAVMSLLETMPNLETMEYRGCKFTLHCLLKQLRKTTVKALKWNIEACCTGQDLGVESPCINSGLEYLPPLTHLDITIDPMVASTQYVHGEDYAFTTILDNCGASLQSLKLSHVFPGARLSLATDFNQLKFLHVGKGSLLDKKSYCSLFRSKRLSEVVVDISDHVLRECLAEMSLHLTLESLALYRLDRLPDTSVLQILGNNPALKRLYLGGELSSEFDDVFMPVLARLQRLELLSITWTGSEISPFSLAALATMKSLEQLHMSTGLQYGTWHDWFIDHETLLSHLKPLQSLQHLVFTRDSYILDNGASMLSAGGYYAHRLPDRGQWLRAIRSGLSFETVQNIWEGQHRYRMTEHAQKYVDTFENLKSIHVGQLTFVIVGRDGRRTAVLEDQKRCEHYSVLENMFGIV